MILLLSFMDNIINNTIMETHGRANHFLIPPGSHKNILLHSGQTNWFPLLLGLTCNTLSYFGRIQIISPIPHSGLAQLPKPPTGLKTGSTLLDYQSTYGNGSSISAHFTISTSIAPKSLTSNAPSTTSSTQPKS